MSMKCPRCEREVSTVWGHGQYPNQSYRCDSCDGDEMTKAVGWFGGIVLAIAGALVLASIAGCAVQAEPVGTRYGAPCAPTDTSPLPKPQPASVAVSFDAGKVYFFCPDFPCKNCDEIPDDPKYVKIKPPYQKGFEWVSEYAEDDTKKDRGYPVMYWKQGGEWRRSSGWKGVDETERMLNPPPAPVTQSGYPIRGGWWSVNGNFRPSREYVIRHLLSGPEHAGKFSRTWLEGLSYPELMSLHSDDHEGRMRQVAPRQRVRLARPTCPGSG